MFRLDVHMNILVHALRDYIEHNKIQRHGCK